MGENYRISHLIVKEMEQKKKEIELIIETLNGNDEAFRELVMYYQKAVYATGLSYLRNEALAKEIVQETFLIAYRNLPHLKDLHTFGKWLKEIAVKSELSVFRKRKDESGSEVTRQGCKIF